MTTLLAGLSPAQIDLITGALGFLFTVALLSYAIGDNPVYRVALHAFIGVAVGYVALLAWYEVIVPRVVAPLTSEDPAALASAAVPLFLFGLLLFKLVPPLSEAGSVSTAYLVGVGAAVALGGAVSGTLVPLVQASWLPLLPGNPVFNNLVVLLGTVTTLIYFQFWLRDRNTQGEAVRVGALEAAALAGRGFIVFTLGMVYGGLIVAGLAALVGRVSAISGWLANILP